MIAQLDLFSEPRARTTDPGTSHLAAVSVKPANAELVGCIRQAIDRRGPLTHEEIVSEVGEAQPGRWLAATVVSACARAGLHAWDRDLNSRGRWVTVWSTTRVVDGVETIQVAGDVL